MKQILIANLLIFFISCSKDEKNLTQDKNYQDISSKNGSSISQDKDNYYIDSSVILNNKNLPELIIELESEKLITKNDKNKIPKFISNFLKSTVDEFSIANPDEKWNASDIVIDKKIPRRKLIYFGEGKNMVLMTYNVGGIGKSTKILIFKFNKEKIEDFWSGTVLVDLKNKEEIIKYINQNINKEFGLNSNILYY